MTENEIFRYFKDYLKNYTTYKKYWNYEDGVVLLGASDMYKATGDTFYKDFVLGYLEENVDPDGKIVRYNDSHPAVDNILCGRNLYFALDETGDERYRKALDYLMGQLKGFPRAENGSFWHKDRYPEQIWLDGLYMASVFYLDYETRFDRKEQYPDVMTQFRNVRKYMFDDEKKLYYHGYDHVKAQPWANKDTGLSSNFWSRACGWWLMALVDALDVMSDQIYEDYREIQDLLKEACDGMLKYRSSEDGLIYQVVDHPEAEGNYTESSGSLMMAYALMKGCRLKALLPEKYLGAGREMFESITENKLKDTGDGVKLRDICGVAGLGPDDKRDGSLEYYLSEPKKDDDSKGVGPLLMACSEYIMSSGK
ncbi:MAG: glycoside hydrolase family 88 protein [Lachnospiraceae bacterium]|nr:glycoside hydrolase family 88 protein [Lachnospiraceae bacterium]